MREHISGQYDAELDELRAMVTEMGGLVERQLSAVCEGLATWNADPAEPVIALDKAVNRLEVRIDDACTHIIAKRQPTALATKQPASRKCSKPSAPSPRSAIPCRN